MTLVGLCDVPTAFGKLPAGWRPLPATARSVRPVFKHIDESTIAFRKDSCKQIEHRGEETGGSCLFKAVRCRERAVPALEDERRCAKGEFFPSTWPGADRARTDRHSAPTACKCWPFVLPVLTYWKYAARRVTKNHHFRLVII